mgnify:CR=1 FL=1|jgi:Site-specific recombinase XerD
MEGDGAIVQVHPIDAAEADRTRDAIDLWLRSSNSSETRATYSRAISTFQDFNNGRLLSATAADIQRFSESLSDLAPASHNTYVAAVKSFFTFMQKMGLLQFNPGVATPLKPVARRIAGKILSEDEVFSMFAAEDDPRNRLVLQMLYYLGLRESELAGICFGHVHALSGHPKSPASIEIFGKGGKGRVLLFNATLWNSFRAWRRQVALRIHGDAEASPDEADPVFVSRKASKGFRAITRQQIWKIVRNAARKAMIGKPVSPHWLRHSHGTHYLWRGGNIAQLKENYGHNSLQSTAFYLHAMPDDSTSLHLSEFEE